MSVGVRVSATRPPRYIPSGKQWFGPAWPSKIPALAHRWSECVSCGEAPLDAALRQAAHCCSVVYSQMRASGGGTILDEAAGDRAEHLLERVVHGHPRGDALEQLEVLARAAFRLRALRRGSLMVAMGRAWDPTTGKGYGISCRPRRAVVGPDAPRGRMSQVGSKTTVVSGSERASARLAHRLLLHTANGAKRRGRPWLTRCGLSRSIVQRSMTSLPIPSRVTRRPIAPGRPIKPGSPDETDAPRALSFPSRSAPGTTSSTYRRGGGLTDRESASIEDDGLALARPGESEVWRYGFGAMKTSTAARAGPLFSTA